MIEEQNIASINVSWESTKLGFRVGFLLSAIYAMIGMLAFIVVPFDMISRPPFPGIIVIAFFIFLYTVLPCMIIGLLTGIIIGGIAKFNFARKIPMIGFALVSMAICGLTALLIHVLFRIEPIWSFEPSSDPYSFGIIETYPFLFGIPTIIYIIAGGWFGRIIHSRFLSS